MFFQKPRAKYVMMNKFPGTKLWFSPTTLFLQHGRHIWHVAALQIFRILLNCEVLNMATLQCPKKCCTSTTALRSSKYGISSKFRIWFPFKYDHNSKCRNGCIAKFRLRLHFKIQDTAALQRFKSAPLRISENVALQTF